MNDLLGDTFELEIERSVSHLRLPNGEDYWELFSSSYGPTKILADSLDDERREELHRSWVDFIDTELAGRTARSTTTREWVLVYGTRR